MFKMTFTSNFAMTPSTTTTTVLQPEIQLQSPSQVKLQSQSYNTYSMVGLLQYEKKPCSSCGGAQ